MAANGPVQFGASTGPAYAWMGYVNGLAASFRTNVYIDAVLDYTQATLTSFFDEWLDAEARARPRDFQHVYEWPSEYQHYNETVGIPEFRLWKHYYVGTSKNATTTFQFLPSKRPVPIDPILQEQGPSGRSVTSVHYFTFKAEAMEFGIPIKVTPKLAKMLAYVGRDKTSGGNDEGWSHAVEQASGSMVNFSKGPVNFTAGGKTTVMKFTTAYELWWRTMAQGEFEKKILPTMTSHLTNEAQYDAAIRIGNSTRTKALNITAQASIDAETFAEAQQMAIANINNKAALLKRLAASRRSTEKHV